MTTLAARLRAPVDGASLAAFRVLFGAVMAAAMLRLLAKGWVDALFVAPPYHFAYGPLTWVRPWPGVGMHVHVALLAVVALALAAGVKQRLCAALLCAGFTYLELIDKALYLNHYYLASLLAGLLALMPARGATVPAYVLLAFRAQIAIVYVYAGIAKLNADWLLRAQPLRTWLAARADLPVVGAWLDAPAVAFAASWAGAAFDLAIVPLLLWQRTRRWAFAAALAFHASTSVLFPIGMFPFIMTAAATLLLAPDWPRRLPFRRAGTWAGALAAPVVPHGAVAIVVGVHLAVQAVLPLRQYLSPGPSAWTGHGFNFAWNVMVADKTGTVMLTVVDPATGRRVPVRPSSRLTAAQESAMAQDPEMIAAFARDVAATWPGGGRVAVFADAWASFNGRPARRLLDPTVDLVAAARPPVLPLEPL